MEATRTRLTPWQLRVVAEKEELDQRAERLNAFLATSPDVDADELGRLKTQSAILDAYTAVLAARIAAWA